MEAMFVYCDPGVKKGQRKQTASVVCKGEAVSFAARSLPALLQTACTHFRSDVRYSALVLQPLPLVACTGEIGRHGVGSPHCTFKKCGLKFCLRAYGLSKPCYVFRDVSGVEKENPVLATATAVELLYGTCKLFTRPAEGLTLMLGDTVVCTGVIGGIGGVGTSASVNFNLQEYVTSCRSAPEFRLVRSRLPGTRDLLFKFPFPDGTKRRPDQFRHPVAETATIAELLRGACALHDFKFDSGCSSGWLALRVEGVVVYACEGSHGAETSGGEVSVTTLGLDLRSDLVVAPHSEDMMACTVEERETASTMDCWVSTAATTADLLQEACKLLGKEELHPYSFLEVNGVVCAGDAKLSGFSADSTYHLGVNAALVGQESVVKQNADSQPIVFVAVHFDGDLLRWASDCLRNNIDIVLAALRNSREALMYVGNTFCDESGNCNDDRILAVVGVSGRWLDYV